MPSQSEAQRKYIFHLRGKYKNKTNTPEDQKWIWNDEWKTIKEEKYMNKYTPFFENDESNENSLSELTDTSIPQKLVDFIKKNPFPKDHTQLHTFAEGLGIDASILEQYAYAFLTVIFTGGKSKGDVSKISKEQLDIGMQIEKEHVETNVDNDVVKVIEDIFKKKISADHYFEDNKYYSNSLFKDELKRESK